MKRTVYDCDLCGETVDEDEAIHISDHNHETEYTQALVDRAGCSRGLTTRATFDVFETEASTSRPIEHICPDCLDALILHSVDKMHENRKEYVK